MDPIILAPAYGDTRLSMWTKSIIGTLVGLCLGLPNLVLVWRLLAPYGGSLLAVLLASFIAGAVQGNVLRPYTRPPLVWLAATASGWLLGYLLIGHPDLLMVNHLMLEGRAPILFGLISSAFQWLMLRRHIGRASCWLWINAVCWYVVWCVRSILVS